MPRLSTVSSQQPNNFAPPPAPYANGAPQGAPPAFSSPSAAGYYQGAAAHGSASGGPNPYTQASQAPYGAPHFAPYPQQPTGASSGGSYYAPNPQYQAARPALGMMPTMRPDGQPVLQEVLPGAGTSVLAGQGLNVIAMKQSNPAAYQEALRRLDNRQYCLGTDESGSMTARDIMLTLGGAPPMSRFRAIGEFASVMAATANRHDRDGGLTIYRFGPRVQKMVSAQPREISAIYEGREPNVTDGTAMVSMLRMFKDDVLAAWRAGRKEPYTLVVFTDGGPSRESNTEHPYAQIDAIISELAVEICKMGGDDETIAISFIQVGPDKELNRATGQMEDTDATKFLNHLDNDLGCTIAQAMRRQGVPLPQGMGETFDIVDTKSLDQIKGMTADDVLIDAMIN